MRTLYLTLHHKWFIEILSGRKTEEYREIKSYWDKRLNQFYDVIHFVNGYGKDKPCMDIECIGIEKDIQNNRYIIFLGKLLKVENC
jgi:hypothetical protein